MTTIILSGLIGLIVVCALIIIIRLRGTNQQLSNLVQNNDEAMFLRSPSGLIKQANTAYCSFIGQPLKHILNRTAPDLSHLITSPETSDPIKKLTSGAADKAEIILYTDPTPEKGKTFLRTCVALRDKNNKLTGIVETFRDISERTKAESERKEALKSIEQADHAKTEFLTDVTHELRSPMNSIVGMNYLIQQTNLNQAQSDFANKIDIAANNLLLILNDMSDYTKLQTGKLNIDRAEFDLRTTMTDIQRIADHKNTKQNLEIEFNLNLDFHTELIGDSTRLQQVILNLIDNSIKFTDEGKIIVSVDPLEVGEEVVRVKFTVQDTGQGMSETQLNQLFKTITQTEPLNMNKYRGSGIGLKICNHLVQLMDGEIEVSSTPELGSTFSFTASLAPVPAEHLNFHISQEVLQDLSVLVIDDDPDARQIAKSYLDNLNFGAKTAQSGKEAIIELEAQNKNDTPYELILIDWQMPELDGPETIKKLKNRKQLAQMPKIIMASAHGEDKSMRKREEGITDAILLKPYTQLDLYRTIIKVFEKEIKEKLTTSTELHQPVGTDCETLKGAKVLIAEDNRISQEVAVHILESMGIDVTVAATGREAADLVISAHEENPFDLVLMDLNMPEMDGIDATVEIRKTPKLINLPIIAMTAKSLNTEKLKQTWDKCARIGMRDHICKPFKVEDLRRIILKWLKAVRKTSLAEDEVYIHNIQGIDKKVGLSHAHNDSHVYHDKLEKFHTEYEDFISNLSILIEHKNYPKATHFCNSLKKNAMEIGALKIAEQATNLVTAIQHENENEIRDTLNKFSVQLYQLLSNIKE